MSNPNTSLNKPSNRSDDIDKEVHLLMKKNTDKQKSTYSVLEELKNKYKDEIITELKLQNSILVSKLECASRHVVYLCTGECNECEADAAGDNDAVES